MNTRDEFRNVSVTEVCRWHSPSLNGVILIKIVHIIHMIFSIHNQVLMLHTLMTVVMLLHCFQFCCRFVDWVLMQLDSCCVSTLPLCVQTTQSIACLWAAHSLKCLNSTMRHQRFCHYVTWVLTVSMPVLPAVSLIRRCLTDLDNYLQLWWMQYMQLTLPGTCLACLSACAFSLLCYNHIVIVIIVL